MTDITLDTELTIYGNTFVTDEDTAIEIYKVMKKCLVFSEYSKDTLTTLEKYNLQIKRLEEDFKENVAAAKALGTTYSEFMRDKND